MARRAHDADGNDKNPHSPTFRFGDNTGGHASDRTNRTRNDPALIQGWPGRLNGAAPKPIVTGSPRTQNHNESVLERQKCLP